MLFISSGVKNLFTYFFLSKSLALLICCMPVLTLFLIFTPFFISGLHIGWTHSTQHTPAGIWGWLSTFWWKVWIKICVQTLPVPANNIFQCWRWRLANEMDGYSHQSSKRRRSWPEWGNQQSLKWFHVILIIIGDGEKSPELNFMALWKHTWLYILVCLYRNSSQFFSPLSLFHHIQYQLSNICVVSMYKSM